LVGDFIEVIRGKAQARTDARDSLESHLLAFAAEVSRHEKKVINMEIFRQQVEQM
jgi:hypothetical protein